MKQQWVLKGGEIFHPAAEPPERDTPQPIHLPACYVVSSRFSDFTVSHTMVGFGDTAVVNHSTPVSNSNKTHWFTKLDFVVIIFSCLWWIGFCSCKDMKCHTTHVHSAVFGMILDTVGEPHFSELSGNISSSIIIPLTPERKQAGIPVEYLPSPSQYKLLKRMYFCCLVVVDRFINLLVCFF